MNVHQVATNPYGYNTVATQEDIQAYRDCFQNIKNNDKNKLSDFEIFFKSVLNGTLIFKVEHFINYLNEMVKETKLGFIIKINNHLTTNHQHNKNVLKTIRREFLITVLAKVGYKNNIKNMFLKDKSSKQLLHDIHTLSVCFIEEKINIDILDLFIMSSNDELESLNENADSSNQDIKSNIINNREQIESLAKISTSNHCVLNENIEKQSCEDGVGVVISCLGPEAKFFVVAHSILNNF